MQSLRAGETGYTSNAGTAELRAAVTAHIERSVTGCITPPEDEVLITVGVSEALFLALKVLLDQGDEVLVAEPCFVANPALVEMAGGAPVPVPTCVDDDFQVTGRGAGSAHHAAYESHPHQLSQQPDRRSADARTHAASRGSGAPA